ncbi:uncharacterized protein EDB93DRAFT_1161384 [Suillus bovinus]|uniref:uncharacterized protein n=1 Tax=Suillus bovinus TaxID=48563 RepID=UPI001B87A066|nr:uncharacterized protein EDB93DRAFT_1161384 [Suillus bovinus]KAG2140478.1 hypothetical protein EDB93DRAFT_1161384 [Suillus bovinus]
MRFAFLTVIIALTTFITFLCTLDDSPFGPRNISRMVLKCAIIMEISPTEAVKFARRNTLVNYVSAFSLDYLRIARPLKLEGLNGAGRDLVLAPQQQMRASGFQTPEVNELKRNLITDMKVAVGLLYRGPQVQTKLTT